MTSGENGLLVEPRNPQALALALVRVLADRDLQHRLGAAGLVEAQQYAWSRVAARVLEIYRESGERARHASWRQEFR
jgi:phosphatidylinositol alpha-mannosyltransferase